MWTKEQAKKYNHEYRITHKDELEKYNHEYCITHKDELVIKRRDYYRNKPEVKEADLARIKRKNEIIVQAKDENFKKICSCCGTERLITDFYFIKDSPDQHDWWCRFCRTEYQKRYNEQKRIYMQGYCERKPEQIIEWRKNNSEHLREYDLADYYKDRAGHIRRSRERRLKLKTIPGHHTEEEWQDLLFAYNNKCFICERKGIELTKDHIIPISKGGDDNIENIIPLCRSCNSRKGIKGVEWYKDEIIKWYKTELAKKAFPDNLTEVPNETID